MFLFNTAMIIIGQRPTLISGVPSFTSSAAIARSHDTARPRPPPRAWPATRAMIGLPSSRNAENSRTALFSAAGRAAPDAPGRAPPDAPGRADPDAPGRADPDAAGRADPDAPGRADPDASGAPILARSPRSPPAQNDRSPAPVSTATRTSL